MKSRAVNLNYICDQHFNDMPVEVGGRYCGQCDRVIVDFFKMSDTQILDYIKQHQFFCGRFRASQLGRNLVHMDAPKKIQLGKAAVFISAVLLGHQGIAQSNVVAPTPAPMIVLPQSIPAGIQANTVKENKDINKEQIILRGKVIHGKTKLPAAYIKVYLRGLDSNRSVRTNSFGRFKIIISMDELSRLDALSADNRRHSAYVPKNEMTDPEHIQLILEESFMGWEVNPLMYLHEDNNTTPQK